jgi:hypothetical protein
MTNMREDAPLVALLPEAREVFEKGVAQLTRCACDSCAPRTGAAGERDDDLSRCGPWGW